MSIKKSVVLICSGLYTPGGIERAVVNNANLFAEKGHPTTLLILDKNAVSFYPVCEQVTVVQHDFNFGITASGNRFSRKLAFFRQVRQLSKCLQALQAGVIICTEYPFTIAVAIFKKRTGAQLISWEHHQYNWLKKNFFWQQLYNRYYPAADLVVCLSHQETPFYKKMGCRTAVIYNYMPRLPKHAAPLDTRTLLTIGWLIKRKGVDLIPEIAEKVLKKHSGWKWLVIGSGPLQPAIERDLYIRNLSAKVSIRAPAGPAMDDLYGSASLVVQLSRSESFGLVLLEALAQGVPCIASDCLSGPAEIITNKQDGLLVKVDDVAGFVSAITTLIENETLRQEMGKKAQQNVQRFNACHIYPQWEKVLNGL